MSFVVEAGYQGWPALWAKITLPLSASITSNASAAAGAAASPLAAQTTPAHIRVRVTKDRVEGITAPGPIFWRASGSSTGRESPSRPSLDQGKSEKPPNCPADAHRHAVHDRRKRPKFGRLASGPPKCRVSPRPRVSPARELPDGPKREESAVTACIVGWAHTPFGRLEGETVESLVVRVAKEALAHAGVAAADVDEIVLGHFNAGFSAQDFTASLVLQASPDLRFKRASRVENACATGSAAVHQGLRALEARAARIVLVVGVEQMTTTPAPEIGKNLLKASYVKDEASTEGGFAGVFGKIAASYFQKYGDQSDALAMIAAKNHKNGVGNPYAQLRKDLGYDFCRHESEKNPFVAGPLKRTDCSLVSDGAAALVLADAETALQMKKPIAFRAAAHVSDFLPMAKRDILKFEGCTQAWQRALESAGVTLSDLSFVETHDCFTVAELIEYEAMGLTPKGQGARAIKEGWTQKDGKLPINPSGGLKAKGHPIGATGVSMHVLSAMQLLGQAPEGMQIKDARLAGIFNMGGAAVANYVSLLEPAK